MRNINQLIQNVPVVTDGAWGTQLQARGLPIGACPDAWNLKHPERVESVARAYVEAGSRVILTNTFGASRITLARHGLADNAAVINRAGAQISREAAGEGVFVFASIGPTGAMLAAGEVTPEEVRTAFSEQAKALTADGAADALLIETMSDLEEAKLALEAALETGLPVIVSMSFGSGKFTDRTMMGVRVETAGEELAKAGAFAVGMNCGRGAQDMLPLVSRLKAASGLPVWVKPNAGLPTLSADGTTAEYDASPEAFARDGLLLAEAGATFVGGCCGSSPEFVHALSGAVTGKGQAA